MINLNRDFWEDRWAKNETGWDTGMPTPPLTAFFNTLTNTQTKILIPGCGNAYEAEYLYQKGFKNTFVLDISSLAIQNFKKRYPDFPENQVFESDFFEHKGKYDLIIEQTFFCALNPSLRVDYVNKMADLLLPGGKLAGLLFNDPLNIDKPPFGGNKNEYLTVFSDKFNIDYLETATNSIKPREGRELFFIFYVK